jgi:hypothetical protein
MCSPCMPSKTVQWELSYPIVRGCLPPFALQASLVPPPHTHSCVIKKRFGEHRSAGQVSDRFSSPLISHHFSCESKKAKRQPPPLSLLCSQRSMDSSYFFLQQLSRFAYSQFVIRVFDCTACLMVPRGKSGRLNDHIKYVVGKLSSKCTTLSSRP